jgi:hypothetical protein
MADSSNIPPPFRLAATGILAWLVPGVGHLLIGERKRGWIILATIGLTFWGGIVIGGVRSTVDPGRLWFVAQVPVGAHAIAAYYLGQRSRAELAKAGGPVVVQSVTSRWQGAEIGTVYTGVAGLLNVLAILDALGRAEASDRRLKGRPKHAARAGA